MRDATDNAKGFKITFGKNLEGDFSGECVEEIHGVLLFVLLLSSSPLFYKSKFNLIDTKEG